MRVYKNINIRTSLIFSSIYRIPYLSRIYRIVISYIDTITNLNYICIKPNKVILARAIKS
jgi:hypothetical protein